MSDPLTPSMRTVGATRSEFEHDFEATAADPTADLGNPDEGGVVVGELLGAGGMGMVHVGVQRSLRRKVAVKRSLAHNPDGGPSPFLAFLREAWITANLEHPNIIPVHTLASVRGDPRLVLKLVEGVAWRDLLEDDALAADHGMRDRLAFHLDILGRVCRAVHFAHTRGIVHLDLKPANVMVGRHGEVYLLDWGIAAGFRDDAEAWVPRTRDITEVCGTPAYLAPEQARALGSMIGPRTDVFLLGGLIHRVIEGSPPHRGETVDDVLNRARSFRPIRYREDVPSELAAIVHRAMARVPDERYASVEELRVALVRFLQHRHSGAILDVALERLEVLHTASAGRMSSPPDAPTRERLEHECRFAIEEALTSWPENARARQALTDLAKVVIERALDEGDWRSAAAATERLPQLDERLWERVRALRSVERAREQEVRALHDLGSNQDILRHARTRSVVAGFLGASWVVWFLAVGWAERSGLVVLTHPLLAFNAITTLALYAGVLTQLRSTLLATQIDRRALMLMAASLGGVVVLWTLCWLMGLEPRHAVALSSGVYMFFFVAITIAMERRLAWMTIVLAALVIGSIFDLPHTFEWQGAAAFLAGTALSWIWRRDARVAAEREAEDS